MIPPDDELRARIDRAIAAATPKNIGRASPRVRKPRAAGSIDPDTPLRLADAVAAAFPHGGMTVSGLRREAQRGRLVIEVIAHKQFVTLRAIERMRSLCRAEQLGQDSGSNLTSSTPPANDSAAPPGLSLTERSKSALAALHKTARELKKRSPSTSQKSTAHPRESTDVIPLKSSSLTH